MLHFDYELEFEKDAEVFDDIGDWSYEVFMINGDALITISADDNVWKFSVPIVNFASSLVTAAEQLCASTDLVEFKDWDSSFRISFVYVDEDVLIKSERDRGFRVPFRDFNYAANEFSERVKFDLETRYPALIKNKAFQQFLSR
jgi:hypothetical protein